MKQLTVEVIAYAPTAYFTCQSCEFVWQQSGMGQKAHAEQMANNLPDDVMNDYRRLSDWIISLVKKHGDQLLVRVVDAASIEGFLKSLRYSVRRYPAVIIAGQQKLSPADYAQAEAAIELRLGASVAAV
jgi:hypothetical protein